MRGLTSTATTARPVLSACSLRHADEEAAFLLDSAFRFGISGLVKTRLWMAARVCVLWLAGLTVVSSAELAGVVPSPIRAPVIYSTDLLHPHEDPDDHFDLACLYAMPNVDLRAVILDNGASQAERPGFKPVWQLNYLSGRHVPAAIGLNRKLKSPEDPALDQPAEFQNGVHLLLQTLRDSSQKVSIIFVGSARDTAAAYNREPALFREKVRSICGFIGEASDAAFTEYNVGLDPQAFVRLLQADVPFYWMPCFDGGLWQNHGHASYWKIRHGDVLANTAEPLQRYFLYMLRKETNDPIAYLSEPMKREDQQWLMAGERNLWAAALLGLGVGAESQRSWDLIAALVSVDVAVAPTGAVTYGRRPGSRPVMRFEIRDKAAFAVTATARTAELLASFPIVRR